MHGLPTVDTYLVAFAASRDFQRHKKKGGTIADFVGVDVAVVAKELQLAENEVLEHLDFLDKVDWFMNQPLNPGVLPGHKPGPYRYVPATPKSKAHPWHNDHIGWLDLWANPNYGVHRTSLEDLLNHNRTEGTWEALVLLVALSENIAPSPDSPYPRRFVPRSTSIIEQEWMLTLHQQRRAYKALTEGIMVVLPDKSKHHLKGRVHPLERDARKAWLDSGMGQEREKGKDRDKRPLYQLSFKDWAHCFVMPDMDDLDDLFEEDKDGSPEEHVHGVALLATLDDKGESLPVRLDAVMAEAFRALLDVREDAPELVRILEKSVDILKQYKKLRKLRAKWYAEDAQVTV